MRTLKLIGVVIIFSFSLNTLNAQELEDCAVKYKMPYQIVKLKLTKISINHKQFLKLLDSLVNHEKKCDAELYLRCKYYWGIAHDEDVQEGFFLYVFLIPYFDTKSSFDGYFLFEDNRFLISKEILHKKLEFILEHSEKKLFISKTPLEPYYIEELPKWLIYYSNKTQKFYIVRSESTKECN